MINESTDDLSQVEARQKVVDQLADDLRSLGVREGGVLVYRGALRQLGLPREIGKAGLVFLEAARKAVGSEGTLVSLAFTRQYFTLNRPKHAYNRHTPTISGGMPQALVDQPDAMRSAHPTNSLIALGPRAAEIVAGHDATATSFMPFRTLLDLDAQYLLVGCVESAPGVSTVHLVQEEFGLANQSPLSGLTGANYIDEHGRMRWFGRKDVPGCSLGFYKPYEVYRKRGYAAEGMVARAEALLIDVQKAYEVDREMVEADPKSVLCGNSECVFCNTRYYNLKSLPRFLFRLPFVAGKILSRVN